MMGTQIYSRGLRRKEYIYIYKGIRMENERGEELAASFFP